jgi:peptidoglycan/LPS O-acetylase OafA/YrhL
MDRVYFKGLNGIRAIAVMIVIVFHIDQFIGLFGLKTFGFYETGMAAYGVNLFFVLSGFLITYLLLMEKSKFEKIDLRKFYLRRIFRIWPVYYLLIIVTVILIGLKIFDIQLNKLPETILYYSFLFSNVGYAMGLGVLAIFPLWSVGVEEQFYSFWPLLISKSKNIIHSMVYVILIFLTIKIIFRFTDNGSIYRFISMTSFDSMAFGGIAAFIVLTNNKFLSVIFNPFVQFFAWLLFTLSIFLNPVHIATIIDPEIYSIVFAIIIINVCSNPKTIVNLENRFMNFIGRISYGLYIYHLTVFVLLAVLLKKYFAVYLHSSNSYLLIYALTILITFFVASISYRFFERLFLRRKKKYMRITSTD